MGFLDARVRAQHPCPFCEFSAAFPDVEIVQWCNRSTEVLQISTPRPSMLPRILDAARDRFQAREIFQDGRSALTMARTCACASSASVSGIAEANGLWLIPPILYREGWETHRLVAPNRTALSRFVGDVRKIGRVEILSLKPQTRLDAIRDLGIVPVHYFEGLTDRQVHALVAAYEAGLFESPARTRMGHVAGRVGVSRSTFGEHLRKAQLSLLRNSYPFLKLRLSGSDAGAADVEPADVSGDAAPA